MMNLIWSGNEFGLTATATLMKISLISQKIFFISFLLPQFFPSLFTSNFGGRPGIFAANGAPATVRLNSDQLLDHLAKFGYLGGGRGGENQRTEAAVKQALMDMQSFAGLNPSGDLDNATRNLLQSKRCGIPDRNANQRSRRNYGVWDKRALTYKFMRQKYPANIGPGMVRRTLWDALQVWTTDGWLSFRETGGEADIQVAFHKGDHEDGYPFDGSDVVLAHAFMPGPDLGGDVHFDADERWIHEFNDASGVHLFSVAAHEFGHSLGLQHTSDKQSVMFPYYIRLNPESFRLPYPDRMQLFQLYASSGATLPPEPETTTIPPTTTTTVYVPPPNLGTPEPSAPGDLCELHPDAIAHIRHELFVFKGKYFWRLDSDGYLLEHPSETARFWHGLPADLTQVNAVHELPGQRAVHIFIGNQMWQFHGNQLDGGYPKPLTSIGLPESLTHIDVAFRWGYNGKTYFMSGHQYWRVDDATGEVEPDYPRQMSTWKGVPVPVDAAYTDSSERTFFIKHGQAYQFNGRLMEVERGWPKPLKNLWSYCKNKDKNGAN